MSAERSGAKIEKMIIWTEEKNTKKKFMSPVKRPNKTALKSL
jgi:hypothetical protein